MDIGSSAVWAKLRLCSWWPGVLMPEVPDDLKGKKIDGQFLVKFFGTNKCAFVDHGNIKPYNVHREKYATKKSRGLQRAVNLCDNFLAGLKTNELGEQSTNDKVELQTEMPLEIKKEADETFDGGHLALNAYYQQYNQVQNNDNAYMDTNQKYDENDLFANQHHDGIDYFQRLNDMDANMKNMAARYDKMIDDLKKDVDDLIKGDGKFQTIRREYERQIFKLEHDFQIMSENKAKTEKELQDSTNELEALKISNENHEQQFSDLTTKLNELSGKHCEAVAAGEKMKNELKVATDANEKSDKKIRELSEQLQKALSANQELKNSAAHLKSTLVDEYERRILDMEQKIATMAPDALKTTNDKKKLTEDYERQLSEINTKLAKVIEDNKKLVIAKKKSEEGIKKSLKNKYGSEIDGLKKEIRDLKQTYLVPDSDKRKRKYSGESSQETAKPQSKKSKK